MYVTGLSLTDFRSYRSAEIELEPGVTAFVGLNGQGKTNLVEAIDYISTLDSHRVSSDAPLVRAGMESAYVRLTAVRGDRTARIELEINARGANKARINANAVPRLRDVVGVVRTVFFSPEDLSLVKGDPSDRRRFLDGLLTLRTPRMAGVRADYDRVLKQRNSLLKTAGRRRNVELSTLDIWDENLARIGGELWAARLALLDDLAPFLTESYLTVAAEAAADRQEVTAQYVPSTPADSQVRDARELTAILAGAITERRGDELERGITLVGPHRDEVLLSIGSLPAKGYASHGESWSLALALRLASFSLLRDDLDPDDPILILDDVFAELDQGRRERLAHLVADAEQVLITAAVDADVPSALTGRRFRVADGQVTRDD